MPLGDGGTLLECHTVPRFLGNTTFTELVRDRMDRHTWQGRRDDSGADREEPEPGEHPKLKRLVGRGILTEPEPGLFTLPRPRTHA